MTNQQYGGRNDQEDAGQRQQQQQQSQSQRQRAQAPDEEE